MSQINLADVWKIADISLNNTNGMRSKPSPNVGLLQLLTSAANKNASKIKLGDVQAVDKNNGKVYKVVRRMMPRLSQSANTTFDYCPTGGTGVMPISDEIEITNETISERVVLDDALLRCILENKVDYQNSYVNEVLRNHMNKLGQEVAAKVYTGGFVGNFVKCKCTDPVVALKDLPLFMANSLTINPVGESIIDSDRKQAEIDVQLTLVGGTLLDQYRKARQIASGNDLGFDASLLNISSSIFYDTNLPAIAGNPNYILAMAPGALQLITYSKHKGQFAKQFDLQLRETTVDPWFGLEHDVIVSYEICAEEVKMYIQFRTSWAVVGMPKCWNGTDCLFDGVYDVFAYEVKCADTGYCDIVPACGIAGAPIPTTAVFCASTDECENICDALFYTQCFTAEVFSDDAVTITDANAILINGLPYALGNNFDLSTLADANAFVIAAQAALASISAILSVSGGYNGVTGLDFNVITTSAVTSITILSATNVGNVAMRVSTEDLINVYDASVPSTNATLTNLSWITPSTAFNGAPTESIVTVLNYFGLFGNFYAIQGTETGLFQLQITDSISCIDTYQATSCGTLYLD